MDLFERAEDGSWRTLREWRSGTLTHTELMLALGEHEEPEDPRRLLDFVPTA
ncbi:MAG: hypothetical protein IT293_05950 [Deltaproteobacteria bacterium]|nr:hypothetical protein [Deltaproteobacteria bacterium]